MFELNSRGGFDIPKQPSRLSPAELPAVERASAGGPARETDEAGHCLQCRRQAPGALYAFFVTKRQSLSRHILHKERVFICDCCAQRQVRLGPLTVLFVWLPWVGLGALFTLARPWICVLLLFIAVGLTRLAWRQLRTLSSQRYHHPPHNHPVARLAVQLRKQQVLRSLHLVESAAAFRTEADLADRAQRDWED